MKYEAWNDDHSNEAIPVVCQSLRKRNSLVFRKRIGVSLRKRKDLDVLMLTEITINSLINLKAFHLPSKAPIIVGKRLLQKRRNGLATTNQAQQTEAVNRKECAYRVQTARHRDESHCKNTRFEKYNV